MYWRRFNQSQLELYRNVSKYVSKAFRFQYPMDWLHPKVASIEKSTEHSRKLNLWTEVSEEGGFARAFVDYKQSKNNYMVDVDGNRRLDLSMQGGMLALGYNPDALIDARASRLFDKYMAQSPNIAEYPPLEFADLVRNGVLPYAPKGMSEVYFTEGVGGLANETAIKVALLKFRDTTDQPLSAIDWDNFASTDLSNSSDLLQNNVCVLGFEHSHHGTTLATQSASGAAYVRSTCPTYDWPKAPMPNLKYPLSTFDQENRIEEDRCIAEVRRIVEAKQRDNCPVGAMIVEPITYLGNVVATPYYYQQLRAVAKQHGIPFIVDETRCGFGKTAKMWAHEHWFCDDSPDIVTFGSSAVASGLFTTPEFRPSEPHKLTTISNGSMDKLVAFKSIADYIKKKRLLDRVQDTSSFLKAELHRVNKQRHVFDNLRGYGTYLGFDLAHNGSAEHFEEFMSRYGIIVAVVGPSTIGLRPSLLLEPRHAGHFRDAVLEYNPRIEF